MYLIIDRFEGEYAVCEAEDRKMVLVKRGEIKGQAREGDVIKREDKYYIVDVEETAKRRQMIEKMLDLWD